MMQQTKTILLLVACLLSLPSYAQQKKHPIFIESDTLLIEEKKGISHFSGQVKFKQGDLIIRADSIKAKSKSGKLSTVVIKGKPIKLDQKSANKKPITASANKIEYFADSEMVHLYGNALLQQGQQQFRGEHIQYSSRSQQVIANGNQQTVDNNRQGRVKAVIMPKTKTESNQ